ncbi:MAG TPA: zinc-ribbon domain-containing protein, partial [Gemmatimonadales bacterium]|nr:zinc-ribbon domain-containing protein [Gemmatimonadales bacterium]
MNVTCPNCASMFRVDPSKVPEGGVRARCNICSAVFAVRREGDAQDRPAAAPPPSTPPPAPAPRAEPVR